MDIKFQYTEYYDEGECEERPIAKYTKSALTV